MTNNKPNSVLKSIKSILQRGITRDNSSRGHLYQPAITTRWKLANSDQHLQQFSSQLQQVGANVSVLKSLDEVASEVAKFITSNNIGGPLVMGNDRRLNDISWQTNDINIERRRAQESDQISVSYATCAIANLGTVVLCSGADNPSSLNFQPENHIVLIDRDKLLEGMDDVWAYLRSVYQPIDWPRAINWISGPSSSGDIAATIALGVHGPRRFVVLVIDR